MEFLECLFCENKYPLDVFNTFCPKCKEPLLYSYSPKKRKFFEEKTNSLYKFLDFLPLSNVNPYLLLGEENTPLIRLSRLMEKYGLPSVFAKNDTLNPTGSFKDKGTAVSVQKAVSLGVERIGSVSTGNMASSTAAYGAKAKLKVFVLMKEDVTREKLLSAGIYGSFLVRVKGDYGELGHKSFSIGRKFKIYFMNSVDPFRIEGYKMTGFEIFLQLDNKAPQYIFVPVSAGGHLIGLIRAYKDLKEQGKIRNMPTFVGVQAQGCSPLAKAFSSGKQRVERENHVKTIAQSISNPDPPGGNLVLKLIRENGGKIISVDDKDILEARKSLAELEGIFCLPASATTLAGLWKLSEKVKFNSEDRIVLVITGTGLKGMKSLESSVLKSHEATLSNLEKTIGSLIDE